MTLRAILRFRQLRGKLKRGSYHLSSKSEAYGVHRNQRGKSLGRTVYFGSEHSDVQIRMYDKNWKEKARVKK